jgi:hypothetical protein
MAHHSESVSEIVSRDKSTDRRFLVGASNGCSHRSDVDGHASLSPSDGGFFHRPACCEHTGQNSLSFKNRTVKVKDPLAALESTTTEVVLGDMRTIEVLSRWSGSFYALLKPPTMYRL